MEQKTKRQYRGAGRPTQEQAKRRQRELLEQALDMFLKRGYEQTTLDEIATSMRMTKRTIYSTYGGKEDLFKASVRRAIEKNRVPLEDLQALQRDDLEATLKAVARLRIEKFLSPDGTRLQRIVSAESYRFPELTQMVYTESTGPTVEFLTELLKRHTITGDIDVTEPEACAGIFLNMAVGTPARAVLAGMPPHTSMTHEQHIDYCVHLFLYGLIKRSPSPGGT